jgi:type III secretion protein L
MDDGFRDDRRAQSVSAPRVIGKVIKSENSEVMAQPIDRAPAPPPRRPAVLNAEEYDAKTASKQIIAEAQARAEEIKAEAFRFKEEVSASAREEARADVQARAAEELARAKIQAGQIVADAENVIVALALEVATKIVGRDLEREPELVLEIVAATTEAARNAKAMVLRVHPEDGKLLREKRPKLMELIGRAVDISLRDDALVERGGCIIQTEFGTIDGQIRTQFEMLRNVLMPTDAKKEMK